LLLLDRRSLDVALRQAEASVAQARAQQDVAGAAARRGASLLEQKLISTSNLEELRGAELRADAQLASALAERDSARLRLSFGALRAPDAGVISARNVQPGQIVNAGTELLRLIRRGRLEWRAQVADNDLVQIEVGAPVSVRSPAGEEITGKVRAVSPAVDATSRTALIYADLPKPTGLRAGMFAEGRIVLGEGKALVLPRAALVYRDGIAYAFLLEKGNRVRQRRVETGGRAGDDIEIRDGLVAGSTVVLRGAGFLNDGDVVKVAETPASTAQLTKEPAKR
jgi:RND family efflux transporter MFP subunit